MPWQISQDSKSDHDDCGNPQPDRAFPQRRNFFSSDTRQKMSREEVADDWQRDDEERVQDECLAPMSVKQLVCRPQPAAARTIPAGDHVKKAARIEMVGGRIQPEQSHAPRQCGNNTAPDEYRAVASHFTQLRRYCRRRQWNADFTSGLHNTISTQIPMGNPTQQHGEMHGTMEIIVAVITIP